MTRWVRLYRSVALAMLLAGCSRMAPKEPAFSGGMADHPSNASPVAAQPAPPSPAPASEPPPAPPPPPPPGEAPPQPKPQPEEKPRPASDAAPKEKEDTQLIIYTAHVTMAVYQVEQGLAAVERLAREMGGYLALKRDREITIRVPRARFDGVLSAIDRVGDVIHRDIQAEDVTDQFVDAEIRIRNAKAMQARLRALLDRAAVKEALEIEKELHRVTEELELLEGKLKLLKDKIAYSTITVMFEPRGSSVQATRLRLPFPWLSELGLPNLLSLDEAK